MDGTSIFSIALKVSMLAMSIVRCSIVLTHVQASFNRSEAEVEWVRGVNSAVTETREAVAPCGSRHACGKYWGK